MLTAILNRVSVSATTLRSLKEHCPKLHTLRLGCNGTADKAAIAVLPSLVPYISQQESSSADSWEEAGELQVIVTG